MMAANTVARAVHRAEIRFETWLCAWQPKVAIGATVGFKEHWPTWVTWLLGALSRRFSKTTGIEPAPERQRQISWKEFLQQHWESIAAADFFTVEVWTPSGLTTFLVLFFIELSTRRVHIAGIGRKVNGLWMAQVARNICDAENGFLNGKQLLIHDRDPLFTNEFLATLSTAGVESVKLPPRSPNLNAYAERFVRTMKESCLDRVIFFGEESLRNAVREFTAHYHGERNHQGLGNRLIIPDSSQVGNRGKVQRRARLGGMLNYYYRAAA